MELHYIVIVAVIAVIVLLQFKIYRDSKRRIRLLSGIFPDKSKDSFFVSKREKGYAQIIDIKSKYLEELDDIRQKIDNHDGEHDLNDLYTRRVELEKELEIAKNSSNDKNSNKIIENIIGSINGYLENNGGSVSDFHLIKDIVDRNCDSAEEAVQSQIPMPLYYGLMGTMVGIIVGVGYLWLSGGLSALLATDASMSDATDGIIALLAGVALAMISSVIGIMLTTLGTSKLKDVKIEVESKKHDFLTWMQTELLPKLSNDMGDVLLGVTKNLSNFNETFAKNSKSLNATLSTVKETTANQAELLNAVNEIKIKKVATANIEVYDKLKNCTDEIGIIGEYLESCGDYLAEVRKLNERLDQTEDRTRVIENIANFFAKEENTLKSFLERVDITRAKVSEKTQAAVDIMAEDAEKQIELTKIYLAKQREEIQKAIEQQDNVLKSRITEISTLAKSVGDVGKTISMLEASTKEQNKKIDKLVDEIKHLAEQKTSGSVVVSHKKMPLWVKILLITGGSIVTLSCLSALIMIIIAILK